MSAPSKGSPSSAPAAPAPGHHQSLLDGAEMSPCCVPGFVERSYPTAAFPRVAVCAPQVGEQHRGGCADVGAVTCVLVAEGGGTRGGRGTGWLCMVPTGAETASPGDCHCLMKMDLELQGDGVEKDGKKPSEMEKRTCSL